MKKFVRILVSALMTCAAFLSLFGCGESKLDGKYYLVNGGAQNGGAMYWLISGNDENPYQFVVGGAIAPENFWVELNDGKMTVHGSVSPVDVGSEIMFYADQETERVYEYTLQTSSANEHWYDIYSNGEDTLYRVLDDGTSLVFEYGKSGTGEYWYNISYEKA